MEMRRAGRNGRRAGVAARGRAGFALVELSVAVVLFGIVSAVALPGLNKFLRSVELNRAVNAEAARLRVVRERAITESNGYRCWFHTESRRWGWFDDDNGNGAWDPAEAYDVGGPLPPWITVTNSGTNPFTGFWLDFAASGAASQSGTLIYTNTDGYSRSLSVVRPTGSVTVQ